MRVIIWLVLLGGCVDNIGVATDGISPDMPPDTGLVVDPDLPLSPADQVRAALAGQGDLGLVISALSAASGLPVVDEEAGTVLFLAKADGATWTVAGDFSDWDRLPMDETAGWWIAEVPVQDPVGQRYKLVADGERWQADPRSRSVQYDENGEVSLIRADSGQPRLDRYWHLDPAGERAVRVWVPADNGRNGRADPVLIAQDGQNLFDPSALWGGWHLQDALATRAPLVVVGVDNTLDRFDEYTHVPDDLPELGGRVGGEADAYVDWVETSVVPFVEKQYTLNQKAGLLGSSLGGLVSLHHAQRYSGQYDFVASLSGTLGWGRFGLSETSMEERWLGAPPATVVFVSSGGGAGPDGLCQDLDGDGLPEDDPDDSDNYCTNRHFVDALAGAGFTWDEDLFHWHEAGAAHNEAAWAALVGRPLDLFLDQP